MIPLWLGLGRRVQIQKEFSNRVQDFDWIETRQAFNAPYIDSDWLNHIFSLKIILQH
jgi:hypothetical protein